MTEYEVADLAFSQIMQTQGLGALHQGQVDSAGELVTQFMTVLFAYLAAAHFIGESLTRRQVLVFTSLYTVWQSWVIFWHTIQGFGVRVTVDRMLEVGYMAEAGREIIAIMPQVIGVTQFILLTAALVASLYFMWDVRQPNTE